MPPRIADGTHHVVLETTVGELRLARTPRHKRLVTLRRGGKFGWTLGWDSALTRAIADELCTDLAGAVALCLFERTGFTWIMNPRIPVSQDPENAAQIEDTPALREAAAVIASTLRDEINAELIGEQARRWLDGEFLYQTPRALKVGQATKGAPDLPTRCFGRLAPFGTVSLAVVAPWLGYVAALTLRDDDFLFWRFADLPWFGSGPEIDLYPPSDELWVKPRYRAANRAVELAAVSAEIPAAVAALPGLPELRFDCEDIKVNEQLGVAFATSLRLVATEGAIAQVRHVVPLDVVGAPWDAFAGQPGLDEARLCKVVRLMCPFGEEDAIRQFAASKELVYHYLWLAHEHHFKPVDPWQYATVPTGHVPASKTNQITYFPFDETAYRSALIEILLANGGQSARAVTVSRIADAFRTVRDRLARADAEIDAARTMGINGAALDRLGETVARARAALGEDLSLVELSDPRPPLPTPPPPPAPVGRATGSPHQSVMPDGTVVENRDERFAHNLQVAQDYFKEHGHLRPDKRERPGGVNLYQWLKNQELRLRKGTMPVERRQALEALPGWTARAS